MKLGRKHMGFGGTVPGTHSWAGYSTSLNHAFHVWEGRLDPLSVPQHREPG